MNNNEQENNDRIWKALADSTRREILDELAKAPQTTGGLVEKFQHLCRTNVMKHLDVLESANLIVIRRQGRTRWNYLNPAPIQNVCDRWVSKHVSKMARSMSRLKDVLEQEGPSSSKKNSSTKSSTKRK